ncbi:YraN family protein [Rhizobium sp. NFR03]|uniref:YraN family protein n=1 Tax=Rhizobium sp. NFR03 TaxID=1566263 RepID=UPI0008B0BED4|nr:YraN family protein [Rhizobium sp. NFR03]SER87061.1 putative endonuclease [Rhizobium sp. NFR03]
MTGAADPRRLQAVRKGALAEYLAALALLLNGYRIVAFRHRTKLGEIDIIARRGDLVACVEVKARNSVDAAIFAVSDQSKARIRKASDLWLQRQSDAHRLSVRYDIISVRPWRWPVHIRDAF